MRDYLPYGLAGICFGLLTLMVGVIACTPQQRSTLAKAGSCLDGCGPLVEEIVSSVPSSSPATLTLGASVPSQPRGPAKRHCTQWTYVDAGALEAGP